jgi:dethiobiotin synthetase
MKPVAAGLNIHPPSSPLLSSDLPAQSSVSLGFNEDVDSLISASNVKLPQELVCPYLLSEPVAPHLAAHQQSVSIRLDKILSAYEQIRKLSDCVIVEGVGGFRVPLGEDFDSADLAVTLDLPVILVVGVRLGCINHALLTVEAITARGLTLGGWVANCISPNMKQLEGNIQALQQRIVAPMLACIPHLERPTFEHAVDYFGDTIPS